MGARGRRRRRGAARGLRSRKRIDFSGNSSSDERGCTEANSGNPSETIVGKESSKKEPMAGESRWHNSWWVGAGSFVLATCVQIGSSVWPQEFKPHPHAFVALLVFGFICIAVPVAGAGMAWYSAQREPRVEQSPLEIIFEPLNPARRFWSLESHVDDYKRLIGNYWEHRLEIKNNSSVTLRNVVVTVEHTGQMPLKPQRAIFVRTKADSCDINPRCSELVLVNRWPHPKHQAGMLAAESAWAYGPIKVTASANDTLPAEKTYDFNYETDQMLFERQE